MSDGRSYPVTRGSLIFVPPGQVHAWEWNEALSGYVLCFEPALLFSGNDRPYRLLHDLAQLSAATKDRPTFQTAGSAYQMLQAAFRDLADESVGNAEFRGEMVRAQITALLIRLHRLGLHTPSAEAQVLYPVDRPFSVAAGKGGRKTPARARLRLGAFGHPRVLVDAVLAETGKSPSAWIRDRTLLEARRLLAYTDLTISEIAYRLNFRNVSYFVRFYRRSAVLRPEPRVGCKG